MDQLRLLKIVREIEGRTAAWQIVGVVAMHLLIYGDSKLGQGVGYIGCDARSCSRRRPDAPTTSPAPRRGGPASLPAVQPVRGAFARRCGRPMPDERAHTSLRPYAAMAARRNYAAPGYLGGAAYTEEIARSPRTNRIIMTTTRHDATFEQDAERRAARIIVRDALEYQ